VVVISCSVVRNILCWSVPWAGIIITLIILATEIPINLIIPSKLMKQLIGYDSPASKALCALNSLSPLQTSPV
jgi:hypothetical protein